MPSFVAGIGTAQPDYKFTQEDLAFHFSEILGLEGKSHSRLLALFNSTGIYSRYSVLPDFSGRDELSKIFSQHNGEFTPPDTACRMEKYRELALPLAIDAVNNCFNSTGRDTDSITHLITVSCTGMYAPGLDIALVKKLGLNYGVKRTSIQFMGCYAAVNALRLADSICSSEDDARVLIVCVELCSLHFQYKEDQENLVASALFGDGASAAMVESKQPTGKSLELCKFHGAIAPDSEHEMAWSVGNYGFELKLSAYVPEVVKTGIKNLTANLLADLNMDDVPIDYYAVHPGGKKILQASEEALGITRKENQFSYEVFQNYGNMSSPTILFVLDLILASMDESSHGKNVLGMAFGPGLTIESFIAKCNYV